MAMVTLKNVAKRYILQWFQNVIDFPTYKRVKKSNSNSKDDKRYYCKRIVSIASLNQEAIVGWFILVEWIFLLIQSKFDDESTISKYLSDQGIKKDYQVLQNLTN